MQQWRRWGWAAWAGGVLAVAACDQSLGTEPDLPESGRLGVTPKRDTIYITDSLRPTLQLTPTVNKSGSDLITPEDPTSVRWSSLTDSIAVVSTSGVVTPVRLGTATIRAEAGGQDADAEITVAYAIARLETSAATLAGTVGDTARYTAQLIGADNKAVAGVTYSFVSSDPTVARLEAVGTGAVRVRYLKSGTVQIRASALDQQATTAVTVTPPRLTVTSTILSGVAGDSAIVTATAVNAAGIAPATVTYAFSSSAPTVATVTQSATAPNTAVVRFLTRGTVTITATANEATGNPGTISIAPLAVTSTNVGAMDVGADHVCGIVGPGRLYCWGLNSFGQLAVQGDSVCFVTPTVSTPLPCQLSPKRATTPLAFVSVSAGTQFSCGLVAGGTGYCWGADTVGQLGNGRVTLSPTPTLITGTLRFASITAGGLHACGIVASGSGAYCWGYDDAGQLGDASIRRGVISTTPIPVVVPAGLPSELTPQPLALRQVSAGFRHTCGVVGTDEAWCWGENADGQLGNGTAAAVNANAVNSPTRVSNVALTVVTAGGNHSCGLTAAGAAYCWGSNSDGQLGTGSTGGQSSVPVAVASGLTFSQIAAGESHTCALTTVGDAYCWGRNEYGQVGYGGASTGTPTAVGGTHRFVSISSGTRQSCGTVDISATDNEVGTWCWGANLYGALGNQLQAAARGTPVLADPRVLPLQ